MIAGAVYCPPGETSPTLAAPPPIPFTRQATACVTPFPSCAVNWIATFGAAAAIAGETSSFVPLPAADAGGRVGAATAEQCRENGRPK